MIDSVDEEQQKREAELSLLEYFRTFDHLRGSAGLLSSKKDLSGLLEYQPSKREEHPDAKEKVRRDELPVSRERSRSKSKKSPYVIKHDQFHMMRELEPELLVESSKLNKRLLRGSSLRDIEVELECLRWVKDKILKDGNF